MYAINQPIGIIMNIPKYTVRFVRDITLKAIATSSADPIHKPMAVRTSPKYHRPYTVDKHGLVKLS